MKYKKRGQKPIYAPLLEDTPAQPQHMLVCVHYKFGDGHVWIKLGYNFTWLKPSGYDLYLFEGKWGRVVIAVYHTISSDKELTGKVLRYTRDTWFSEHNLKFVEQMKND